MKKIFFLCFILICFPSFAISDGIFLSLKKNKVNVRYGPGFDYEVKYIYRKKNLPVKVIDKKENFRKITDFKKNSGWIHRVMLKQSNSLIVLEDKIVFKKNSKLSKPLVKLEKGRLVLVKKCMPEWCKIKTGKFVGWIETKNIWGKVN